MNQYFTSSPYTLSKALKTDKKDILRFYKAQHYPASYIGQDHGYIVKVDGPIIASAIISAGQQTAGFWLLHGLVINKAQRGSKIGSLVLQAIVAEKSTDKSQSYEKIVCFADKALHRFYEKNNFRVYNTVAEIDKLPGEFKKRLISYQKKQPNLCCYFYNSKSLK